MVPPRVANRAPDSEPPRFTVEVPAELADVPDEPTKPLDLEAFERWANEGDGPWRDG